MDIDPGTVPIPTYPLLPTDLVNEGLTWLTTQHFRLRCDELMARNNRPGARAFVADDYLRLLAVDRAIVRSVEASEWSDVHLARAAGASWWALARVTEQLNPLDLRNDYVRWLDDECGRWDASLAAGAAITEGLAPHDRVAAYCLAEVRIFGPVEEWLPQTDPAAFTFGPRPPGVPLAMYYTKATTECDECGQGPAPHCTECGACTDMTCDCDDESGRGDSPAPTGGPAPDDDRGDELRAGDELPPLFDAGALTAIAVHLREDEPAPAPAAPVMLASIAQQLCAKGCCYPAVDGRWLPTRAPGDALRHAQQWWPAPAPDDMPEVVLVPAVTALLLEEVAAR